MFCATGGCFFIDNSLFLWYNYKKRKETDINESQRKKS